MALTLNTQASVTAMGKYLMTLPTDQNQVEQQKQVEKENNFRALEAKYQRELERERGARLEVERQLQEAAAKKEAAAASKNDEDDAYDPSEPYVDHKRLDKRFNSFERKMEAKIEQKAEEKARLMVEKERRDNWLKSNPDYYDVLQHAEKFAEMHPDLAETILQMPEGFERQKLVYKNIKTLGINQPPKPVSSVQEKVDANRRSPYYQPSGPGAAPYAAQGDFSPVGQKNAYDKMKQLQQKLRM